MRSPALTGHPLYLGVKILANLGDAAVHHHDVQCRIGSVPHLRWACGPTDRPLL